MGLGELIHDDTFSLYEAMSAIEMMDPKMDAGMLCNRGVRQIKSFEQAVEDKILKLNYFGDKEIIGIIDTTFACLTTWLEGHSLAKTVFINLYLHKPYKIDDKTLKVRDDINSYLNCYNLALFTMKQISTIMLAVVITFTSISTMLVVPAVDYYNTLLTISHF